MPIILHLALAATVDLAQPLTAQQSVTVDYPEVSRDALLGQILPKLKRTARDPYSIRDFSLCSPRGLKLKNGRPDYWTLFFSFNAKNAFGGYAGIETWFAVFRKGRLSGELYRTQLDVTAGLMGMLMDRPGLKQVLADVASGQIDVVVLYKIDRLTRSLSDFARIVDVLDRAGASFVSVTQSFNTTTSMGRLTLNVLLSFAQFEREVGAERVRDKIAASKKKGMWMGGVCPLGYDVQDRALIVNEAEAETVRLIFALYLKLGSVNALEAELCSLGICSKRRTSRAGKESGGKPFSRGALYVMLRNVLYMGQVGHRGQSYPGRQAAILDEESFTRTQQMLEGNTVERRAVALGVAAVPLLAGLLSDEHGRRMSPTHASKGAKRYRYYVSRSEVPRPEHPIVRVPAGELENLVIARLQAFLLDTRALHDICEEAELSGSQLNVALDAAKALSHGLGTASPGERAGLLKPLISSVALSADKVRVAGSLRLLCPRQDQQLPFEIAIRSTLVRRKNEIRLIVPPSKETSPNQDAGLIKLVVRAHQVRCRFESIGSSSVAELASELGYNLDYCTVLLKLSYLSPKLTGQILDGRQPQELTRQQLARVRALPTLWSEEPGRLGIGTNPQPPLRMADAESAVLMANAHQPSRA